MKRQAYLGGHTRDEVGLFAAASAPASTIRRVLRAHTSPNPNMSTQHASSTPHARSRSVNPASASAFQNLLDGCAKWCCRIEDILPGLVGGAVRRYGSGGGECEVRPGGAWPANPHLMPQKMTMRGGCDQLWTR